MAVVAVVVELSEREDGSELYWTLLVVRVPLVLWLSL